MRRLSSSLQYDNAMKGATLRCSTCPQGFKDEWLFDGRGALPEDNQSFTLCYEATGLRLVEGQDGNLQFMDAADSVIFTIAPAAMWDANEVTIPLACRFAQEGDIWRVQYLPDAAVLNAAAYPVTLDPLVYTGTASSGVIEDTRVRSDSPNSNYHTSTRLYTQNSDSTSTTAKREKSYLKVNVLPALKPSDYIVGAYLRLRKGAGTVSSRSASRVRELTAPVTMSTVTFNTAVSVNPLNKDHQAIVSTATNYFFDLTDLVKKWYANPTSNHGVGLFSDNYIEFYSANDTGSGTQPYLMVNYMSLAGMEGYLSYDSTSLGIAGQASVSLCNGNLIFSRQETSSSGGLPSVSISRHYNSCFARRDHYGFGCGWRCNYNLTLHLEAITNASGILVNHYVLMDGDGTYHYFKDTGANTFEDMSGLSRKLSIAGSTATLTDKTGTVLTFATPITPYNDANDSSNNYITALKHVKTITDARGHTISIALVPDGSLRIMTISDATLGTPRVTSFYPLASGRVSEIVPPGYLQGAGVRYAYDTSGRLTTITDVDDLKTVYTYNADYLLVTASDAAKDPPPADRRVLTLTYANATSSALHPAIVTAMRVATSTATAISKEYTYGSISTKVTDKTTAAPYKSLVYHFNDRGNLISVNDELGYSISAQYTDASPMNHPDAAGRMERAVINLLTDGSFELANAAWTDHNISGTGTFVRDQSTCQAGLVSKRITIAAGGASYTQQAVAISGSDSFTLSGYIKTSGSVRAILRIVYVPSSGQPTVTVDSAPITNAGSFTRVFATLTSDSILAGTIYCRLMADTAAGSAWFDCIQLEKGETVNRYNLLQNADFRQGTAGDALLPTFWEKDASNALSYFELSASETIPSALSGRAVRLRGRFYRTVLLYQEIRAYGNEGDVYVAGGWAKGYAKKNGVDGDMTVRHAINVQFSDNGTYWATGGRILFSHEEGVWQMVSGPVKAPASHIAIRFVLEYQEQINDALFTNLFLYQERSGHAYQYDTNGNLLSAIDLAGTKSNATYDSFNNLLTFRAPGRPSTQQTTLYFGANDAEKQQRLPRTITSPTGVISATTYDPVSHCPTTSLVKNAAATLLIGSKTEYHTGGNYASKQYDARGKLTQSAVNVARGILTSATAPNGQVITNTYDNANRLTEVNATYIADGVSKTAKSTYAYTNGQLTKIAHNTTSTGDDVAYNFAYDSLRRPATVKVGTATTLSTNSYNADGTLANVTYGNGGKLTYIYDAFRRVIALRYDASSDDRYRYAYDAEGRLAWVSDEILGRIYSSAYDIAGRPMLAQTLAGTSHLYSAEVAYDAYNSISAFKEQVGTGRTSYNTTYAYDAEDRPTTLTFGSAANSLSYVYDGVGRVGTRTAKIGDAAFATVYNFLAGDAARYGSGASTTLVGGITQPGHSLNYTYDDMGSILSCAYAGKTTTYAYDTLGQLIRVNDPHDTTSGATGTTWTYHYDQGGNILSVRRYAYTTGTLGTVLQTHSYGYTDADWKDKLTSYNGVDISYDAIGNPTAFDGWALTWQAGRQLVSMSKTGTAASFQYNADGLRVRKTVNGVVTDYTLHGKNVVHLTQGSNSLHFFYDASGKPSHVNFNGTMYLYVHNLQGDIIAIRDAAGNNVVTYSYNAWGKQLSKAGTMAATLGTLNPFRYRGYVYDEETGLYYLRSRYYNPGWGRFVNADVVTGNTGVAGHNQYSYCRNNPVVYLDPTGNTETIAVELLPTLEVYRLNRQINWMGKKGRHVGGTGEIQDLWSGLSFRIAWGNIPDKYHTDWSPLTAEDTSIIKAIILESMGKIDWRSGKLWDARPGILTIGEGTETRRIAVGFHLKPHGTNVGESRPGLPDGSSLDSSRLGAHMCMYYGDSWRKQSGESDSEYNDAARVAFEMCAHPFLVIEE